MEDWGHAKERPQNRPRPDVVVAQDPQREVALTLPTSASFKVRHDVHAYQDRLLLVELPYHDVARRLVALPLGLWKEPDAEPIRERIPLAPGEDVEVYVHRR